MNNKILLLVFLSISLLLGEGYAETPRGVLPGELTAEQILNGEYLWPPSPEVEIRRLGKESGFDAGAFGKAPQPGVHPRLLFSPSDLPIIRNRIQSTEIGSKSWSNLTRRVGEQRKAGTAYSLTVKALMDGEIDEVKVLLDNYLTVGVGEVTQWHHRDPFTYLFLFDSFQTLIGEDTERGAELAKAATTLYRIYKERLDEMDTAFREGESLGDMLTVNWDGNQMHPNSELNSDAWRSGRRQAIGYHEPTFALIYDFVYNWMNEEQRTICRETINTYIHGKTTMGSHMPHHFRNWNWIVIGSGGLATVAAVTLGEEGNDARVYEHAKEIIYDYLRYGWSQMGSSREAVGYTQFGIRWLAPAMVILARNGDNFWNVHTWYNSTKWYAQSTQPEPGRFISHGDGGHAGVQHLAPMLFKNAYPNDPVVDYILKEGRLGEADPEIDRGLLMLRCIFAVDPDFEDHKKGQDLGLPVTFFDPERNQLITRTEWGPEMVKLEMECRADSYSPSHEHADRGSFTFAGAGKTWAIEHFRGVESRHHNVVTIDNKGQGYFAPPGKWIELIDNEHATFGVCDAKYAYDWYFQGTLSGFADPDQPRRNHQRWARFALETDAWLEKHPDFDWCAHIDPSPQLEAYWGGYEEGDPRMWDEYSRPVRVPHNPVDKAFRTAGLVRGNHPYALIVDDIKAANGSDSPRSRTYNWNMMVDTDVDVVSIETDTIFLTSDPIEKEFASHSSFKRAAGEGSPQLMIKVLNREIPKDIYQNPEIRLETLEHKEIRDWPAGRSFGLAKRLVVPSFSVEPKFKMFLFPHYNGDELPAISWSEDRTVVTVEWSDQTDVITFREDVNGRTRLAIERGGKRILKL
jgi:hypothetical protein